MNTIRLVLWAAVVVAMAVCGYLILNQTAPKGAGEQIATIGGSFNLIDNKGQKITQDDLLGRPHAIFFGFTNCPEICPTTLYETAGWLKELGDDGDKVDFYFFTVDPARDTPEILNDYVNAFDPRITAVTGSEEEMLRTIKKYRAYAKKVDLGEGDYTMDHSASIMLFKPDGRFKGTISYGETQENAVAKLKMLVKDS